MAHAKDRSLYLGMRFIGGGFLAVALTILLAAACLAQDAGVSGIAPGPANVNNAFRDPSGIGNAAKMPPLPQPTIRPVTPLNPTRPLLGQGSTRVPPVRTRSSSSRARRSAEHTTVRENDRLLNHGITSICRGC